VSDNLIAPLAWGRCTRPVPLFPLAHFLVPDGFGWHHILDIFATRLVVPFPREGSFPSFFVIVFSLHGVFGVFFELFSVFSPRAHPLFPPPFLPLPRFPLLAGAYYPLSVRAVRETTLSCWPVLSPCRNFPFFLFATPMLTFSPLLPADAGCFSRGARPRCFRSRILSVPLSIQTPLYHVEPQNCPFRILILGQLFPEDPFLVCLLPLMFPLSHFLLPEWWS